MESGRAGDFSWRDVRAARHPLAVATLAFILGAVLPAGADEDLEPPTPGPIGLAANVLLNPGFETNGAAWIASGSAASASSLAAESDSYGLAVTNDGSAGSHVFSQWIAPVPGTVHRVLVRASVTNYPSPVDIPLCAGYWPFDEGTGTTAYDGSTNANHATLANAAYSNGIMGFALGVDGVNAFARAPSIGALNITGAVTMAAWTRFKRYDGTYGSLALKGSDQPTSQSYGLFVRSNGRVQVGFYESSIHHFIESTGSVLFVTGQWQHVVGTIDTVNDRFEVYLNGVLISSTASNIPGMATNAERLYMGGYGYGDFGEYGRNYNIDGIVDEVAVYPYVLSSSDIQRLYRQRGDRSDGGLRVESYDATGLVGAWETNFVDDLAAPWRTYSYTFTPPAGALSNKVSVGLWNLSSGDTGTLYRFDNAYHSTAAGSPLSILLGTDVISPSDFTTAAVFTVTDGNITNVTPSRPMTISLGAFDSKSGLSRGTTDTNTQTHLTVGTWMRTNVVNYDSSRSSSFADTFVPGASSTWYFASANAGTLFGSNRVSSTLRDADFDEADDQASRTSQLFGVLVVTDDDAAPPVSATLPSNTTRNSGFETNAAHWTLQGPGISAGSAAAEIGAYGLRMTNSPASLGSTGYQWVATSGGNPYRLTVSTRSLQRTLPPHIAYWRFDEGSGNLCRDESTNGYTLTKNENIRWATGPFGTTSIDAGNPSGVLAPNKSISFPTAWTIALWFVHPIAPTGYPWRTLFNYQIMIDASSQLGAGYPGVGFYPCGYSMTNLAEGWHHMVVVAGESGANNTKFYIDGALVGQSAVVNPVAASVLTIYPFGVFDELMVLSGYITANQVASLYSLYDNGTPDRMGIRVESFGAGQPLASATLDLFTHTDSTWAQKVLNFTTPAGATSNRISAFIDGDGSGHASVDIDNLFLEDASAPPLSVSIGGVRVPFSDATTGAVHTVTDGALTGVGAGAPLRFTVGAYDLHSGLSRGTTSSNAMCLLSVGTWVRSNMLNYVAAESSPPADTSAPGATSTWSFTSVAAADIDSLMGSNAVRVTLRDADFDRTNDATSVTNLSYGNLVVRDDDSQSPLPGSLEESSLKNPGFETNGALWTFFGAGAGASVAAALSGASGAYVTNAVASETNGFYQWMTSSGGSTQRLTIHARAGVASTSTTKRAHWTFDEGTGGIIADSSGNGYTGVLVGAQTWLSGRRGQALTRAVNGDRVTFANRIPLASSYSVAVWFKAPLADIGLPWNLLALTDQSCYPIAISRTAGKQWLGLYNGGFRTTGIDLAGLSPGWHFMAVAAKNNSSTFYIDGQPVGSSPFTAIGSITELSVVGGTWGAMDDLVVYDGSLSDDQVWQLYAGGNGARVEHYGSSGYLGATNLDLMLDLLPDWQPFNMTYTTPAGTLSNKIMVALDKDALVDARVDFDNAAVYDGAGPALAVRIGAKEFSGTDATTNAVIRVTDQDMAGVNGASPLRVLLAAYDVGSGVSRGTTDTNTQTHLSIGTWITGNVTNYDAAESSPLAGTMAMVNTSVWRFVAADLAALMGTNRISATLIDADADRTADRAVRTNQQFGYLAVVDDDSTAPSNFNFNVGDGRIYTTNDVASGLWITGQVQDAESGVLASPNHTYALTRDGVALASGAFSLAPSADGDARTSPGSLAHFFAPALVRPVGSYTLHITNFNHDADRPNDAEMATEALTFVVTSNGGPVVQSYVRSGVVPASYAASVPPGFSLPEQLAPFVTTNMVAPYPNADWWTSVMRVRGSGLLAARPIMAYAKPSSLDLRYPYSAADPSVLPKGELVQLFDPQSVDHHAELRITATGGSFSAVTTLASRVDAYGDFSVRIRIGDTNCYIRADLAHGSPYAYTRFINCSPLLDFPEGYTVEYSNTNQAALVVKVRWYAIGTAPAFTNHYAIFAPSNTEWVLSSTQVTPVISSSEKYLAVAPLPSRGAAYSAAELALLRGSAFVAVTNTVVDFAYTMSNATVEATYKVQTQLIQGDPTNSIMGLLPLHWKNTSSSTVPAMAFDCMLGTQKLFAGDAYTVRLRSPGIVPQFPAPTNAGWNLSTFESLADRIASATNVPVATDTYNMGKQLARVARVMPAMDVLGLTNRLQALATDLRTGLEDMFTYSVGETNRFFAYEPTWGTLLGYGQTLGSVDTLNDHHFHYGMYVYASAILGMYDRAFVTNYGPVVDKLVRDYNNPSRNMAGPDPQPWLRHFDPWEGHSWAAGLGGGAKVYCADCGDTLGATSTYSLATHNGNDEESSSEAMNAWAAMYLWGMVSTNAEFRDMGAIGYTMEAQAIREYTYDADVMNRKPGFTSTMASRLFGDRVDTTTFFSDQMQHSWGIQYILTGPHMTYQGHYAPYRATDYAYFTNNFPGGVDAIASDWKDIHYMYRCFFDVDRVLTEYTTNSPVNNGNTEANLYYWINTMKTVGRIDTNFYSDYPSLVVTTNGGTNYIAYNFSDAPVTARVYRLSDGSLVNTLVLTNTSMKATSVRNSSITDGQVATGGFAVAMTFADPEGVETTNTLSPFFIPEYDLISPSNVVVLTNEKFQVFSYLSPTAVDGSDASHPGVAYAGVVLGTYTTRWSAISSNANRQTLDSVLVSNATPITFDVVDDDIYPPHITALIINSNNVPVSDAKIAMGDWGMGFEVMDISGVATSPAQGVVPSYDVVNAAGVTLLNDQPWVYVGTNGFLTGFGADVPPAPYPSIGLGMYSVRWSATDRDNDRTNDALSVTDSASAPGYSTDFLVYDDDVTPPPAPSNVVVSPVSWTNVNYWNLGFLNPVDPSGIYEYRISTNSSAPVSIGEGFLVTNNYYPIDIPATVVGGDLECATAAHADPAVGQCGWRTFAGGGGGLWWKSATGYNGTSSITAYNGTTTMFEAQAGWYSIVAQDVVVTQWNPSMNLPFTVEFHGKFLGDATAMQAFLKLEALTLSGYWVDSLIEGVASGCYGSNVTDWTHISIGITNWGAAAQVIRFGMVVRGSGWGYFDDLTATIRVASTTMKAAVFTNAPEGIRTNWFFVSDDDNDRPNDRLMGLVTNFITMYDGTKPATVKLTNAIAGSSPDEVVLGWTPCPDAGGAQLSPWDTYVIYYTDQNRAPRRTDPSVTRIGGPDALGTNTTTSVTISNLPGDATYNFAVVGRDRAGNEGDFINFKSVSLSAGLLVASQFSVNNGNPVTDQDIRQGDFPIGIHFRHARGVESTNVLTPYFIPSFDLVNPSAAVVLTDERFSDFDYNGPPSQLAATSTAHAGAAPGAVEVGTYSLRASAVSSNAIVAHNVGALSNGAPMSFNVVDDDTIAPSAPTNVIVETVGWTNINLFRVSFGAATDDVSGIYQYRYDTNATPPGAATNGQPVVGLATTMLNMAVFSNQGFEIGGHAQVIPDFPANLNAWQDFSSDRASGMYWNVSQAGTSSLRQVVGAGPGQLALAGQHVWIGNTNGYPVRASLSASFSGNVSAVANASTGAAFLKMEFYDANTALIQVVHNEYPVDHNGSPLAGVNCTGWSNATLTATNGPAGARFMRFMLGIGPRGTDLPYTGYWDNVAVTVQVVGAQGGVFTCLVNNAQEGICTNWLFAVDDDDDRSGDRRKGANTNFITMLDLTPPPKVLGVMANSGPDEASEIQVTWSPAPNAGNRQADNAPLSPWRTYVVFYEACESCPVTTNSPSVSFTNIGYANLGTITTPSMILSNLDFDATYRFVVAGRDQAGNLGELSDTTTVATMNFAVTQGLVRASSQVDISWIASPGKPYDVLYMDVPGYWDGCTNLWTNLMDTVTAPVISDAGSGGRPPPWDLVDGLRFYRVSREGKWKTNAAPRLASREIYVSKTHVLRPGENWISLPMRPDTNRATVAGIFGTNRLPAGSTIGQSTRISWYGHTVAGEELSGVATNVVWLSASGIWTFAVPPELFAQNANDWVVPLHEAFNIEIPGTTTQKLVVVGRLPTNAMTSTIYGSFGQTNYSVLSYAMPCRIAISNLGLKGAGFVGGANVQRSDEIRILDNSTGQGSMSSPKRRIWMTSASNFVFAAPYSGSAEGYVVEPGEALIFVRKRPPSLVWTNALFYTVPGKNMNP